MTDTFTENMGGEKLLFLLRTSADGVTPKVFGASCSINTSTKLDLTSEVFTGKRANCTDPSSPSKMTRRVTGQDVKFNGAGTADAASQKAMVQKWLAGQPVEGKVIQDDGGAGAFEIDGTWIIESLGIGGNFREDQDFDIAISTAGDFEFDFG